MKGFPGYITGRPIGEFRVPQHVQQLVIRDHAQRHGLMFKLSGTEYVMPACYMMLEQLVSECSSQHDGVILYSMFMLPQRAERRRELYQRVIDYGAQLHAAVEDLTLAAPEDVDRWEIIIELAQLNQHRSVPLSHGDEVAAD